MKLFSSALSQNSAIEPALSEVSAKIKADLGGKSCDLAIMFLSEGYDDLDPEAACASLRDSLCPGVLIGCNSSGVIANQREVEMKPAVSLIGMHLERVKIQPFHVSALVADTFESGKSMREFLEIDPAEAPNFILLADPANIDVTAVLSAFNRDYPASAVVGGLASGMVMGAENWLVLNDEIYQEGGIGVALTGEIEFETFVSQGCRPVGEPYIITKAERNVLYELAGRPAMEVLTEMFMKLPARDQKLAQNALFVGLAIDEARNDLGRGDFLVRNIVGADEASGALSIGELLETGQTLQFQLRDSETSKEDLSLVLKRPSSSKALRQGALLVSCCGRGEGLYGVPDHDVKMIQALRGPMPLAGFFANGEFGPVAKKNFVHGYTSSLTIIR
ncbi:MAG: FIST C-terminal domain-containing protein [Candidatus Omnitrophica bacterium]|nr:FIST C-terminal domain-containing protein [Candidatus Omnitrophota bacterium]